MGPSKVEIEPGIKSIFPRIVQNFSSTMSFFYSFRTLEPVRDHVLRDDGADGGGAAPAAHPARRRRGQAEQEGEEEELLAGEFENAKLSNN